MSTNNSDSEKKSESVTNIVQFRSREKKSAPVAKPQAQLQGKNIEIPAYRSSRVLKADDKNSSIVVQKYQAAEMIGKRVARPASLPASHPQNMAVQSLKQNLKTLNDLHDRLKFMLQELEEFIKE